MKIVKQHKNRSAHSEAFGIYSGKTLADIEIDHIASACTHGGTNDQIDYVKVGNTSHGAFLWFDDISEVSRLGRKLVELAEEYERRQENVADGKGFLPKGTNIGDWIEENSSPVYDGTNEDECEEHANRDD